MVERLQQGVDDLVWTAQGAGELTRGADNLWKWLSACSDSIRRRVVSHADTRATEHYCTFMRLRAIDRGLPSSLEGALEPLVLHHVTVYQKYTSVHTRLLALDRAALGTALTC